MKKIIYFVVVFSLLSSLIVFDFSARADEHNTDGDLTIVFSHDLHSHIDPFLSDGQSVGGFARIKSIINAANEKYENTLVLDAGDFSMGTLFQAAFETAAVEYRMLSYLGYDAIAFGNHEFDYGFDSLKNMIGAAKSADASLPPILCSNLNPTKSGLSDTDLSALNIKEYTLFKEGEYTIAVFGLLGRDAVELSYAEELVFDDYIDAAKDTVAELKNLYSPDVIICLSHGGTGDTVDNEDVKLAEAVDGIDVIISGHTHTTLEAPIITNGTIIASCGEYGVNIGEIVLDISENENSLVSYKLTPINNSITPDQDTLSEIEKFRPVISEYLARFGYTSGDQIIAYSPYEFPEQDSMGDVLAEQPLGNLISDSYIHAIKSCEGENYVNVDVSVTPLGVIRSSIDKGYITVSQVYEISSLGIGEDGVSGYPLCSVYLYGSELWDLAEIDASVSGIMSYAQLYCSGIGYSANTNRMFMNRVFDCWLIGENGERIEIEEDKLYRVVSGITSAEMLGTVKDKSFGLLQLTPKDKNGNPIDDFSQHIITDSNGAEIKEWKALADYLSSFPADDSGVSVISSKYSGTLGRKTINNGLNLSEIFVNWNFITWAVFALVNLLIAIVALIIVLLVKRSRRKKKDAIVSEISEEISAETENDTTVYSSENFDDNKDYEEIDTNIDE